jgi:hypothetical protein
MYLGFKRTLPQVGAVYRRKFGGRWHTLTVVREHGRLGYKVGREVHPSLSAAAREVTGAPINGWEFWQVKTRTRLTP